MNWNEFEKNFPSIASILSNHLEECNCEEDISLFSFEEKNGIVRAIGPNDKADGVPPLWYIPSKFLHEEVQSDYPNGYCTGDPDERETQLINESGFQYDWRDYVEISLNNFSIHDDCFELN